MPGQARSAVVLLVFCLTIPGQTIASSICYGTTAKGRLGNGVELPSKGRNFVSYGTLPEIAGRTYVHSRVRTIVTGAYKSLETMQPGKVFKYAETGFQYGGPFKPHKTHQNGLSADFMVPVLDKSNKSVYLPTNPLNRYGYDVEFDNNGRYGDLRIDFEALAAHLVALHKSARAEGADLWRVILAPEYKRFIFQTKYGGYLKQNVSFSKRRSWVRHDEHYHVDFEIPCRKL